MRGSDVGRPLYYCSDEELARMDIAAVNLACCIGLPGAEVVEQDTPGLLALLDRWAGHVRRRTAELVGEYHKAPHLYQSYKYFLVCAMVCILQDELGVYYDEYSKEGKSNSKSYKLKSQGASYSDSRQLFIHGMLLGKGGCCGSMPVMYVAIGRRLGYPMKLVTAGRHVFARWEEADGTRFNVEGTNDGLSAHSDEYYVDLLQSATREPIEPPTHLVSLSPRHELALFYDLRADCLLYNGDANGAADARTIAAHMRPDHAGFAWRLQRELDLIQNVANGFVRYYPVEDSPLEVGRVGYWIVVPEEDKTSVTWDQLVAGRQALMAARQSQGAEHV